MNVQGFQSYDGGTDLEPLAGAGHVLPRGDIASFSRAFSGYLTVA